MKDTISFFVLFVVSVSLVYLAQEASSYPFQDIADGRASLVQANNPSGKELPYSAQELDDR